MPKANEIILQLKAENKQLKAQLNDAQNKVNQFSKKTKSNFMGMQSQIKSFLIGSFGIFGLIRGIKALINIQELQGSLGCGNGT